MLQFEWDGEKNRQNQAKHGLSFEFAQYAFADHRRGLLEEGKENL